MSEAVRAKTLKVDGVLSIDDITDDDVCIRNEYDEARFRGFEDVVIVAVEIREVGDGSH